MIIRFGATGIGLVMYAKTLAKTKKLHREHHLEQKHNLWRRGLDKLDNKDPEAYELFKQATDKSDGPYATSIGEYEIFLESNIWNAQYQLGRCYVDGIGCKKNESKGFSLMFDAVEKYTTSKRILSYDFSLGAQAIQGLIEVCYHNGDINSGQLVNNGNPKKVFDLITKLALHKDDVCLEIKLTAMIELGYIYNKGLLDVEIDETKGSECYAKAMDLKNAIHLDREKGDKESQKENPDLYTASYMEFLKSNDVKHLIMYLWIGSRDKTKALHLYTKTMDILRYLIESKEASEDEIQALKKLADSHLLSWQNSKTR